MKQENTIVVSWIMLSVVAALGVLLIDIPQSWQGSSLSFYVPLSLMAAAACLHIGSVWLFLSNLKVYTAHIRYTYVALSVAIMLTAVGMVQLPVLEAFNLWGSYWVTHGGSTLPLLLSCIFMYGGTRKFALLVQAKTILTNAVVVVVGAVIVSALFILIPHAPLPESNIDYYISNGTIVWTIVLDLAATVLAIRISQHSGAHYKAAMAWLAAPVGVTTIALFMVAVHDIFTISFRDAVSWVTYVLTVVIGLLWLGAGYAFAKTKEL